jgi:uncharacterized membrane protein
MAVMPPAAPPRSPSRTEALVAAALLAAVGLALLLAPHGLLDLSDRAAFAVCHRIPDRGFTFAGRPLPLCARCSGMYLGAVAAAGVLAARGRTGATRFAPPAILALLAAFTLTWAADGANSTLSLLGLPHLYEPGNGLRLVTGSLQGIVLVAFAWPVVVATLARSPRAERAVRGWTDLAWMLIAAGGMAILAASGWDPLLYPLALLSGAAVLGFLSLLNVLFLAAATRFDAAAPTRLRPVMAFAGIVLALVELAAAGWLREALTARFGLPL